MKKELNKESHVRNTLGDLIDTLESDKQELAAELAETIERNRRLDREFMTLLDSMKRIANSCVAFDESEMAGLLETIGNEADRAISAVTTTP